MLSRLRITPERYHQVALAALVLLTLIVFSGAAVRLTGSGLGCPDWPRCYDQGPVYAELNTHAMIEFTNRLFSGIVALGAIAAGALAFFRVPPRRDLKVLGVLLPLGVVAQAVLGGLTVKYDLKPGFVMGHYALSLAILVAAWALFWRSRPGFEEREERRARQGITDRLVFWLTRLLLPLGGLMVLAGTAATAAGPHAGGAGTGDLVKRLYVKGSDTLDWAVHQHTVIGAILGVVAVAALGAAWWRRAPRGVLRALGTVVALLGVQGIVGQIQYQAQLPSELVWVHVALATVTWVALLWAWSAVGEPLAEGAVQQVRSAPAGAGAPAARES